MDFWTSLGRYSFFETERLYLRPFVYTDCKDFWEISSNPENLAFIFPSQVSQEESDFLLVHYFMREPLGVWAIVDRQSQKMIGAIRFEKIELSSLTAEIGYFLNKQFWRQGMMTECIKTLTFLSFQEFGLKNLHIIAHDENQASRKVALKAGFKLQRRFKGSDRYTRKMRTYVDYQVSKDDYHYE